ncbi:MAG: M48 family metalloprotease [Candidatus Micrarchaeota archaeon]|nr:M48 family metalloprotease [Candidatus Micrarchaeota archaeon]
MASFFDEIARNNLRSFVLLGIFAMLFIGIIYFVVYLLGGGLFAFFIGAVLVLAYAAFTYYAGDKLVLAVSRAKEADEKQYANLYASVEGLSSAMQIKMPKIYIINDPNPNAFATGRRSKPSIAFTSGLLSMMNRDELEGVISHELSHVADNDILVMTIAIAFAGAIGLIAAYFRNMIFWGFGFGGRGRGNLGVLLLVAFAIGLLAPLFALLIRLAISRRREYMADANGARVTRNPAELASALKKIQAYEKNPNSPPVMHANEVTAPLYFANPFKASSFANLFSTHPPIEERIKRLQAMY